MCLFFISDSLPYTDSMHIARRHYRLIALIAVLLLVVALILLQTGLSNTKPASFTTDPASRLFEAPRLGILDDEEAVSVPTNTGTEETLPIRKVLYAYVEVTDGCGVHFEGECLNVRSGLGTIFQQSRNSVITWCLKSQGKLSETAKRG